MGSLELIGAASSSTLLSRVLSYHSCRHTGESASLEASRFGHSPALSYSLSAAAAISNGIVDPAALAARANWLSCLRRNSSVASNVLGRRQHLHRQLDASHTNCSHKADRARNQNARSDQSICACQVSARDEPKATQQPGSNQSRIRVLRQVLGDKIL
jgi:hypothetical protein